MASWKRGLNPFCPVGRVVCVQDELRIVNIVALTRAQNCTYRTLLVNLEFLEFWDKTPPGELTMLPRPRTPYRQLLDQVRLAR